MSTADDQLRDRIAAAIRDAAHDCDGHCGLTEDERFEQHPIQVSVIHHDQIAGVYGYIDALADVAAAAVQDEADWDRLAPGVPLICSDERHQTKVGSLETRVAELEAGLRLCESLLAKAQDERATYRAAWHSARDRAATRSAERDAARAQAALAEPGLHPEQRLRALHELLRAADPTTT